MLNRRSTARLQPTKQRVFPLGTVPAGSPLVGLYDNPVDASTAEEPCDFRCTQAIDARRRRHSPLDDADIRCPTRLVESHAVRLGGAPATNPAGRPSVPTPALSVEAGTDTRIDAVL